MRTEEYRRMYELEDTFWWYRALRRRLICDAQASLGAGKRAFVLDVGCGTGANAKAIAPLGAVVALDLSKEAMEFCSQRGVGSLIRGSALSLPFRSETFDLAICADVLYHDWVDSDTDAIGELRRVLKPGATLIVHVAALDALRGSHDIAVMTKRRYTAKSLRLLLGKAGFVIETLTYRNALILPLVYVRRRFAPNTANGASDLQPPIGILNRLMTGLTQLEDRISDVVPLPLGASVYCRARRPAESAPQPDLSRLTQ